MRATNCLAECGGRTNETSAEEEATSGKGIDLLGQRKGSELIVRSRTGYDRRLLEETIRATFERRSYIWTVHIDQMNLRIVITGCRTDFLKEYNDTRVQVNGHNEWRLLVGRFSVLFSTRRSCAFERRSEGMKER